MISVIVPAHNEEAWIGRSLAAASAAVSHLPNETIVVDDASTDRTVELARAAHARVLRVEHRQISATRNAGARVARGDVYFFVDADTLLTAPIVEEALRAISAGAVGGGCIARFEGRVPWWFRAPYPLMVFAMRYLLRQTGAACLFCTREAFVATGGFSEAHFAAEEDLWVRALKRVGRFAVLREPVTTSGRSLRSQSVWTIGRIFLRLAIRGADGFRDRSSAHIWYQPKREEPPRDR